MAVGIRSVPGASSSTSPIVDKTYATAPRAGKAGPRGRAGMRGESAWLQAHSNGRHWRVGSCLACAFAVVCGRRNTEARESGEKRPGAGDWEEKGQTEAATRAQFTPCNPAHKKNTHVAAVQGLNENRAGRRPSKVAHLAHQRQHVGRNTWSAESDVGPPMHMARAHASPRAGERRVLRRGDGGYQ